MFSTDAAAQGNLFVEASRFFDSGQYLEASIEYERVIYNQPEQEKLYNARYKKALCYRHLGRYEDAMNELNKVVLFHADKNFKIQVFYEKAFNLLLSGHHSEALLNIRHIGQGGMDEASLTSILPLKILILNRNREWEQAEETFYNWLESLSFNGETLDQWKDTVSVLYSEEHIPEHYSEEKARNWSRFIPGAGQTYTGHPWEGAGSFLLNGAAIGLGIHQVWYGYYFTGYVAGFGVFYKTYFGGMERSANLANLETENEMVRFNKRCSRLIQKLIRIQ